MPGPNVSQRLSEGCVIPAHPLALTAANKLDERCQRALTRYYLAAGAGGVAMGVHTTQFAIHDPKVGLYKPVLELAAQTAAQSIKSGKVKSVGCVPRTISRQEAVRSTHPTPEPILIAGLVGSTSQAVREAQLAVQLGYDLGLLSLTALRGRSIDELIDHAKQTANVIPIMGFYLQSTISHMVLPKGFWSKLVEIPNVRAIKIAPFNRYQTLDVLEAVAESGRANEIALYTGNDDNIIIDLLTSYTFRAQGHEVQLRMVGGLLGQWACWTKKAAEQVEAIHRIHATGGPIPAALLTLASQMTLANKALFDADSNFAGCIPGISYVLKQQGLMSHVGALDPADRLSPGQTEQIDQILRQYPHLTDDEFVQTNLDTWLAA
ncbi:MAG: dihydrodipicolinate synthase family protein [Planctomycetes bacterium]|nr:dihydrodipicolinate synthase family protein [Planctomycetota bacterium]